MNLKTKSKKGSSMVTVLIIGLFLALAGMAVLSLVIKNLVSSRHVYEQNLAFEAAEAGIEKAMTKINDETSPVYNFPFDGKFNQSGKGISEYEGNSNHNDTNGNNNLDDEEIITIISTGYSPNKLKPKTVKKLKATVKKNIFKEEETKFEYAIQSGNNDLDIGGTVLITGDVQSNGTSPSSTAIRVRGNSQVSGDAYTHQGNIDDGGRILGNKYLNSDKIDLPDINLSEWKKVCEQGTIFDGSWDTSPSEQGNNLPDGPIIINGDLIINNGLTIKGAIWVTGAIELNQGTVKLDDSFNNDDTTGRPLSTFVFSEKEIKISNQAIAFQYNSSNNFPIFVSLLDTEATSANAITFNGKDASGHIGLYAKNGEVEFHGAAGHMGTTALLCGKGVTFSGNGKVIYDNKLKNFVFHSGINSPKKVTKSWQIID